MTFVLAWVAFPLALALIGLGWGALVEDLSGARLASGALRIPLGLAAALVVAALLTTNPVTARLAVPVDALAAVGGLVRMWRAGSLRPVPAWSLAAAIGVLAAYGAPVLASGTAAFTGFVKLDDTATWLGMTAQLFAHGHSTAGLAPSTYKLMLDLSLGAGYPVGGFMLLGVGRGLVGVDAAWVLQPDMACAGAALALCLYALLGPLVPSRPLRATLAFVAAQPALLYGYSLWGGIKEMTAAFLVAAIAALAVPLVAVRPAGPRSAIPLAVAAAALIVTFGAGTAVWVLPALGVVAVTWTARELRGAERAVHRLAGTVGALAGLSALLALPVWLTLSRSLPADAGFASSAGHASTMTRLGNLRAPLSAFQLAGVWPTGDLRAELGSRVLPVVLIALVLAAAAAAAWLSVRARAPGLLLYGAVTLAGAAAIALLGGVPWVVAKALAIASPAVLVAGLAGGALIWTRSRVASGVVVALIGGGVLWSNALAYRDATLAPAAPLQDLEHIGELVAGRGPTFVNDFELYADRYFLRAGDPVEPADLRPVPLALLDGSLLGTPAATDLDSFAVATLAPYRSIVTTSSPTQSRPSSLYRLVWAGRYYELWQRPAHPTTRVLAHIPYGDSTTAPYCGGAVAADGAPEPGRPICPIQPVGTPSCQQVAAIARIAASQRAEVVAALRPPNTYVRGDQMQPRTGGWSVKAAAAAISAIGAGQATVQITRPAPEQEALWLVGSFGGGLEVSLDGRAIGRVANDLSPVLTGAPVADVTLSAGINTLTLTHPGAGLAPASGNDVADPVTSSVRTTLAAVVLAPAAPSAGDLRALSPQQATSLCGRSVDWIEIVSGSA